MEDKEMEFLPLGSIVSLHETESQLWMIIDRVVPDIDSENQVGYFDYLLIPYPNGYDEKNLVPIQREEIKQIYHLGYFDNQDEDYIQQLENFIIKENIDKIDKKEQFIKEKTEELDIIQKSSLYQLFIEN